MKNILLVADAGGEIGWGHAMRTLAVAEALEGRASVRWLTSTPKEIRGLNPPCPVDGRMEKDELSKGAQDAVLVDRRDFQILSGGKPNPLDRRVWYMIDHGTGLPGTQRICPHFGAESRDWGPGMVATGPRWMPLRGEIRSPPGPQYNWNAYNPKGKVLTYRAGTTEPNAVILSDNPTRRWWTQGPYRYAIAPPSTIAYECMALGIPVYVVSLEGYPTEIGDAMVQAGVAMWYADSQEYGGLDGVFKAKGGDMTYRQIMAKRAREHVDGRGAERVANLLLGG